MLREKAGNRRGAAEDARKALKLGLEPGQTTEMNDLLRRLGEQP